MPRRHPWRVPQPTWPLNTLCRRSGQQRLRAWSRPCSSSYWRRRCGASLFVCTGIWQLSTCRYMLCPPDLLLCRRGPRLPGSRALQRTPRLNRRSGTRRRLWHSCRRALQLALAASAGMRAEPQRLADAQTPPVQRLRNGKRSGTPSNGLGRRSACSGVRRPAQSSSRRTQRCRPAPPSSMRARCRTCRRRWMRCRRAARVRRARQQPCARQGPCCVPSWHAWGTLLAALANALPAGRGLVCRSALKGDLRAGERAWGPACQGRCQQGPAAGQRAGGQAQGGAACSSPS